MSLLTRLRAWWRPAPAPPAPPPPVYVHTFTGRNRCPVCGVALQFGISHYCRRLSQYQDEDAAA